MFKNTKAFSGFSVDNLQKAKEFYGKTLGLPVIDEGEMGIGLRFANGGQHFIYPKPDHTPATFTVLNFPVDDIDSAVEELKTRGIQFERYDNMPVDEKGILRGRSVNMGPDIAWFKDPAGNVLSVIQENK